MHVDIIFFVLNAASGCQWMMFPFFLAMLNQPEVIPFSMAGTPLLRTGKPCFHIILCPFFKTLETIAGDIQAVCGYIENLPCVAIKKQ